MTDDSLTREVPRVLVLAGSSEASLLAARLSMNERVTVISSFAGRVKDLSRPPGLVRVGGFGGAAGLARWLRDERIAAVIDATHPFTAHMPAHALEACDASGVPRLRILRPEWKPEPDDQWLSVPDLESAATMITTIHARRVFLTSGRQHLAPFAGREEVNFLVRTIEAPDTMPLAHATVLLDRGPFDLAAERALFATHDIDCLVTKNSGGAAAGAKLVVARERGIPVIMVTRPPHVGPTVNTVEDALGWCESLLGLSSVH